jgi:hypothetical protein
LRGKRDGCAIVFDIADALAAGCSVRLLTALRPLAAADGSLADWEIANWDSELRRLLRERASCASMTRANIARHGPLRA